MFLPKYSSVLRNREKEVCKFPGKSFAPHHPLVSLMGYSRNHTRYLLLIQATGPSVFVALLSGRRFTVQR